MTPEFVEHVIRREKPDGIVVSMGGQTALNCAVQLHEAGILEKYNVQVRLRCLRWLGPRPPSLCRGGGGVVNTGSIMSHPGLFLP